MQHNASQSVFSTLQDIFVDINTRWFCVGFILLGLLAVVITRITTTAWSWPKSARAGREPPVAPYWIPYLQHLPQFLANPNETFRFWKKRYPNTPFTLMMMNTKFHVFSSAATTSHIFSRSREFVFEPVVASMMENGVNLPMSDRPKFQLPLKPHQMLSEKELESREFLSSNHSIYLKYLAGGLLEEVMKVYMMHMEQVMNQLMPGSADGWVEVNYHELMQRTIFETSVITFFGTRLKDYWPSMWEDWKLFNDATFAGVRSNLSFYLRPKALAARERMLRAFDKWVDCELGVWPESVGVWNGEWGIKMNWEREILARKSGFSHRGRACIQAGFLFVIVTNSAPMATWFTVCIQRSPGGFEQYLGQIQNLVLKFNNGDEPFASFDNVELRKHPYVQGVWKEALRTGSASAAARVVVKDSDIENYLVRPGSVVMIPVQLLHFDSQVFPDPERIDPGRWMIDNTENLQRQNANLRSFGGGTGLCSGRFVAEQEIINLISTMLLLFELEFVTPVDGIKLNPCSIGIMSPMKDPIVRLRRRTSIA